MALKSSQNPNIPVPTNPCGIDATIYSINEQLVDKLDWLDFGYGRAWQKLDNTQADHSGYFPKIFRGKIKNTYRYFNAIPDNDKKGQVFFIVKKRKYNRNNGSWGKQLVSYPVAMVFSVNMALIDKDLLCTEIFLECLIKEVTDCLKGGNIRCTNFIINIDTICTLFKEVFAEFPPMSRKQEKVEKAPKAHFRFNLIIEQWEDC